MPSYHVHYWSLESGEEVPADGAVEMDLEQLLELMDRVLTSPGCFVSAAGADGTMIQFVVDEGDIVLLDVPAPQKRGSFGKRDTLAACKALMRTLGGDGPHVSHEDIEGLTFERW
jgi:hypothetical protein